MQAAIEQGTEWTTALPRAEISRLRWIMASGGAVYLFCTAMMLASIALFLGTGEAIFLALPLPFLAPMLPGAFALFKLTEPAIGLERDGIRLGDDFLSYAQIRSARLDGSAAHPIVHLHCVGGAPARLQDLPLRHDAASLPGVYEPAHLDFVEEINRRVRAIGNPGLR